MIEKIILTVITFLVSSLLGYSLGKIKELRALIKTKAEKEQTQNEALKCLLQNSLTNIYFVYNEVGELPDYAFKNWVNLMKAYEGLDGDDYVHELDNRIRKMKVKVTGIIK